MARSSSPPMPFGYSFHDGQDFPYHQPPAPAPGPALLDDCESHMLDNFFDTIGSGTLDDNDYFLDGLQQPKGEAPSDFGWVEDLPPVFHGSTTSFTHPTNQLAMVPQGLSNDISIAGHRHTNTSQQGQIISPSAEMLAAASTLVQNGQLGMQNRGMVSDPYAFRPPESTGALRRGHSNRRSVGQTPAGLYSGRPSVVSNRFPSNTQLEAGSIVNGENMSGCMFYGNPNQGSASHLRPTKAADIRWGSDASFFGHGFVAPPNQETVEEVTNTLLHKMECLEPQPSAANTPPSSPILRQRKRTDSVVNQDNFDDDPENGEGGDADEGSRARPKKRRKAKLKVEEDEGQPAMSFRSRKRGKSVSTKKIVRSRESPFMDTTPKRERSQSGEQKSGRENLSTEQKRSNHILSEQKRRNLIKQGFDDLCMLVPELKGGGFSKSAMLTQAADWLEALVQGNEKLKVQLAKLKERDSI
ncbi:Myc-type, basic helix-loop-helix (bHLH) domain [Lasallia pustulata]|uniref:Myc-type, basic helix-loop-helix (BHLH) domain n=1 Tax=Lasallia pustulata TaxID=136370 RepID=A0A1W5CYF1_9LECA|nr:Myc-type, basic helix-loop-helix (bHLH) domain [Lasallia pustulata]